MWVGTSPSILVLALSFGKAPSSKTKSNAFWRGCSWVFREAVSSPPTPSTSGIFCHINTHSHKHSHTTSHPHKTATQTATHTQAFLHTQYTLTKTSTHSPTPHTQTYNTHTLQTHYHISTRNAQTPIKLCSHTHSSHADTCKYILTQKHKYYINPQTHTHKH